MWTIRKIIEQLKDEELDYKIQVSNFSNEVFDDVVAVNVCCDNKIITLSGRLL